MSRPITTVIVAVAFAGAVTGAYLLGRNQGKSDAIDESGGAGASASSTDSKGGGSRNKPGGAGGAEGDKSANQQPLTVKQILAKLKTTMRGGAMQNPVAMMRALTLLDQIRPEDLQEALAEAESITDPQQKMLIHMALLGKWAERDGPAAMKYAEDHSKSLGVMGQMAKMSVASSWAESDPEAVWKWYKDSDNKDASGPFGGGLVLTALFSNLASKDPDAAFKRLSELDGTARQMALAGMTQSALFDEGKRDQLLKQVESLADADERKQAKQMLVGQWAMLEPEKAVEWMKKQPAEEQGQMRDTVGSMLMMSDPKKGAAFIMEGATEEDKSRRYSQVISQWANMDTNAAGEWLNAQPKGPHLDSARQSFVTAASSKDPESAMAWAGTITNAESRVSATTQAYKAWKKKDGAAADQALQSSGLNAQQIETVKNGAADNALKNLATPAPPQAVRPTGE